MTWRMGFRMTKFNESYSAQREISPKNPLQRPEGLHEISGLAISLPPHRGGSDANFDLGARLYHTDFSHVSLFPFRHYLGKSSAPTGHTASSASRPWGDPQLEARL
jgi:hypothetical protein